MSAREIYCHSEQQAVIPAKAGIQKIALFVKSESKKFQTLGAVLFMLLFVSFVLQFYGAETGAISDICSFLSALMFGLPHVAEWVSPSRKPVKDMNRDEILQLVKESDSKSDWIHICKEFGNESEIFYRDDPRLRFRTKYTGEGIQCENFQEPWANRHPDSSATGYFRDLHYDGNLLKQFILVSVDGGRASVPPPKTWGGKEISAMDYKVAQIYDTLGTLDEYIRRSGLIVESEDSGSRFRGNDERGERGMKQGVRLG